MVHASNLGVGAFQLTKLLFIMEFRSFTIEVLVNKHENYASCCDAFMHNEIIIYGITNLYVHVQLATSSVQTEVPCNGSAVPGEHQAMD